MSIHIRPAESSDAINLSQLICENAEAMLKPHYSAEQWEIFFRYYSPKEVAKKIDTQKVFCAEKDGEIVGTIALEDDFVLGFYTRLQNLKQGIGKILISHLEQYALEHGVEQLQLAASPVGLGFYYKNGWQKVRDFVAVHYGVGYEETLMIKQLLPAKSD